MGGIVFEHVGHVFEGYEGVVYCDDLKGRVSGGVGGRWKWGRGRRTFIPGREREARRVIRPEEVIALC